MPAGFRLPPTAAAIPKRSQPNPSVRECVLELIGLEQPPSTADYEVLSAEEAEPGLRLTQLQYENVLGERVPAIICHLEQPSGNSQPRPGVVCLPGTSSSAQELTCTFRVTQAQGRDRLLGWARELARRGFVTISPTLMGCETRRGTPEDWSVRTKLLAPYGLSPIGLMADEALRAAALLSVLGNADGQRVGITGFSLGGQIAWWSMAVAPWLKACAALCGSLGSMRAVIHEGDPHRHGPHFYIPHLLRCFDHDQIVTACIQPRPLLVIAPTNDEDMPRSGVDELRAKLQPRYQEVGQQACLAIDQPEDRHIFRQTYFERMARWFAQRL